MKRSDNCIRKEVIFGDRVAEIIVIFGVARSNSFLFTTASRTALGPTQPPIQWMPGALSLGVKRPGREADHSPPSSVEIKE
jgi:hypothetical protein